MMPRGPNPNADDLVVEDPEGWWTEAEQLIGWLALPPQRKAEMWFRRGRMCMHSQMEGARKKRRVPAPSLSAAMYVCLEDVASRGPRCPSRGSRRSRRAVHRYSQRIMHARLYPAPAGCVVLHFSLVFLASQVCKFSDRSGVVLRSEVSPGTDAYSACPL
jgi:hypothetical protein